MAEQVKKIKEDEIDLVELVKTIWSGRKLIFKITCVFVMLGLVIALTSKVEFTASCKLLPESQEGMKSNLGGLSSLAGLAGINLDLAAGGSLSPELYPEIVNSLPNQLKIINDTIVFEAMGLRTSSFDYFENYDNAKSLSGYVVMYTIGLPGIIKSWFIEEEGPVVSQRTNIYRFSKDHWKLLKSFKDRISINIDSKTGLIDISVEMPDAVAAAQLADRVVSVMTESVIDYKIKKVKNNLDFVQMAYSEAENKFAISQEKLAMATDRNKHINSAAANIQIQTLQNEYNLAFEVFKGLASQLEQAKIKLKQVTPVFTILEPIRVPENKSKPKRMLLLIGFAFFGGLCGMVVTLVTPFIKLHFMEPES